MPMLNEVPEVAKLLATLLTGEPVTHGALAVIPLLAPNLDDPDWLTLEEAGARARVTEVSEAGSVPFLQVATGADRPLLLLDGEELIGAKQNRILNTTVLVAAHAEVTIPVSCVEQGRWGYRGRQFRPGDASLYASLRAKKAAHVSQSVRAGRGHRADQGEVWAHLADRASQLRVDSATGAMRDVYARHQTDLTAARQALAAQPGQVGALIYMAGRWVGLDLLAGAGLFGRAWPRLCLREGCGPRSGGASIAARGLTLRCFPHVLNDGSGMDTGGLMQPTRESLLEAVTKARAELKSRASELSAVSRLLVSLGKALENASRQTPAGFSAHQQLADRLRQHGFTDLAERLVDYVSMLTTGDRNSFERDFPNLCEQAGLLPLTGRLDEGYRIRGAIEVRPFFSKGHVRISTIGTSLNIAPPTTSEVVHATRNLYRRLFERPFAASSFTQQLVDAFQRAGGRFGDSVPLRQVHSQLFLAHQTSDFLKDMSPRKLKVYAIDEFAVDIARYLESRPGERGADRRLTFELGREGIVVFSSHGAFESYKFLKVD